jgi:hypothetical protein
MKHVHHASRREGKTTELLKVALLSKKPNVFFISPNGAACKDAMMTLIDHLKDDGTIHINKVGMSVGFRSKTVRFVTMGLFLIPVTTKGMHYDYVIDELEWCFKFIKEDPNSNLIGVSIAKEVSE